MTSLRTQRLAQYREAIATGNRRHDLLFWILYGLPADMQIALLHHMTARFLPIFRAHHPDITWPEEVLGDLEGWYSEHEQCLYDEPENSFGGDGKFRYALYALLRALYHAKQDNLPRVTPACCTGLIWAVDARGTNVWHADDPEAVRAFEERDREALYGHSEYDNVASDAVRKREWTIAIDWLEAHNTGRYPDTEDAERETWFEWWREREYNL